MTKLFLIFFFLSFTIFATHSFAQEDNINKKEIYEIVTKNGYIYTGYIIERNNEYVEIDLPHQGVLRLFQVNIKSISNIDILVEDIEEEEDKYEIKQEYSGIANKYFLSQSALPVEKGDYYYSNTMLILNDFVYGITNNLTLGVNANIYELFESSLDDAAFSLSLSYSQKLLENLGVSFGVKQSRILKTRRYDYRTNRNRNIIALYGDLTIGNKNHNISLGYKHPFREYQDGLESARSFTLSGITRVSNLTSIMFETFTVLDHESIEGTLIALGARSKLNKIFIDYGVFTLFSDSEFEMILPLLSIKVPISQF